MINIGIVFTKIPQEFFHMHCQQAVILHCSTANHLSLNNEIYIFTALKFHLLVSGACTKSYEDGFES